MKKWIIFLLITAIIASVSLIALNIADNANAEKAKTAEIKEEPKETENSNFSTFTSAVCEEKEDLVHCKDEVFVDCNGTVSKAGDVAECNGTKLAVPKATGFAVFEKGWKDPRI